MPRKKEYQRFKIGDRVSWTSQAAGCYTSKTGYVSEVIPAKTSPRKFFEKFERDQERYHMVSGSSYCLARKMESYIVLVDGGPKGKKMVYWPAPSRLKPTLATALRAVKR
jgi:hypothetical protein